MEKQKYHFIYKTTNTITGRYYYGMHSTYDVDDGYLGSGKRLRYSIRKYGTENHIREIIEFVPSRKELEQKEKEIVNLNEISKENCLNLIIGGDGGRGFTREEQVENARKSNAAQKKLWDENGEWAKARRNQMSKEMSSQYQSGKRQKKYFCDWNGRHHTEAAKRKIGEANSSAQKGTLNSQFGTIWVTNRKKDKKIKKCEWLKYKKLRWKKGRSLPS